MCPEAATFAAPIPYAFSRGNATFLKHREVKIVDDISTGYLQSAGAGQVCSAGGATRPETGRILTFVGMAIVFAVRPLYRYRERAVASYPKGCTMYRLGLSLLLSAALAVPVLAQKKEEPKKEEAKKEASKVAIPTNTFFKGQTASQYLASEQLIGVKVTNKDGQAIGTISDLIIGSGDKIEGVILGVGGFLGVGKKEIGVRLGALKIGKANGKIAITFPAATKEMLAAVGTYERPGGAPAKK